MPPAKKRKTAAKAKGKAKDHVVTATASSPPPTDPQPPEPAPAEDAKATSDVPEGPAATIPEPSTSETTVLAPEQPAAPPSPEKEADSETPAEPAAPSSSSSSHPTPAAASAPAPAPAPGPSMSDRMARFRALQTRAKTSSARNLTAAQSEAHRLANDPSQLAAVQRRAAVAGHKLLRADVEDAGGDFERKRAWDWTVDESERWDERQRAKEAHRDDNAFSDYRREANKVYHRQLRNLGDPDLERYTADKMRAIEAAAARGSLEIVETGDGEMVAVDKDGTFYGGGGGKGDLISSFADSKPDKKAVDRLVAEMRKADEVAARKRRERAARNGDDADVTYINDKNKQFNQKLSRFYNKYTAEIRDSFERGTMI